MSDNVEKNVDYHESVIKYNQILASAAREAMEAVEHPVVKKWCLGIARQHEYYERKHKRWVRSLTRQAQENNSNEELKSDEISRLDAIIEEAQG